MAYLFKGRINRRTWLLGNFELLFVAVVLSMLITLVFRIMGLEQDSALSPTTLVTILLVLPLILSLSVRRLHDIGKSGWLALIGFVPVLGSLLNLYLLLGTGESGNNQYGAVSQPKWNLRVLFP